VSIGILVCGLPGTNYFLEFRRAQAESVRKTVNEYGGLLTLGGVGVGGCAKKALAGTFTMPWLVAPSDLPGGLTILMDRICKPDRTGAWALMIPPGTPAPILT
jgi:hypothetical protein